MLERFLEQHKAIYNVLSDLKSDLAFPSLSDLKDLAMLRDYLKPFQEVTTVMSSEKNVTASSVITFMNLFLYLDMIFRSLLGDLSRH